MMSEYDKDVMDIATKLMASWIIHHASNRTGSGSYAYSNATAAHDSVDGAEILLKEIKRRSEESK